LSLHRGFSVSTPAYQFETVQATAAVNPRNYRGVGFSRRSFLLRRQQHPDIFGAQNAQSQQEEFVMVMGYADPFETLFAFQRALENRLSSDWLGQPTLTVVLEMPGGGP
jgi:hypothetical protein